MNKRIVILTANYNWPHAFDSYRLAFFEALEKLGIELLVIQASDFYPDFSASELFTDAGQLLQDRIKAFRPAACVFINAIARTQRIQDFLSEEKIRSLSWFWDHPAHLESELLQPSKYHRFASANHTFILWLKNRKAISDVSFISFPCIEDPAFQEKIAEKSWSARQNSSVFMGSIWDPMRYMNTLAEFEAQLGHPIQIKEFLSLAEKDIIERNEGRTYKSYSQDFASFPGFFETEHRYLSETNNYFSSLDRLKYLKTLTPLGIKIYGYLPSWTRIIYSTHPELEVSYQFKNILDPKELMKICGESKIGLNIFHRQNQGGGTNFRFYEYAMAGTPILSTRNSETEKIFPNREGAFYFNSNKELLEVYNSILADPSLAVRVAKNAYEIALDFSNVVKIKNQLLELLGLQITPHSSNVASLNVSVNVYTRPEKVPSTRAELVPHRSFSARLHLFLTLLKSQGLAYVLIRTTLFLCRRLQKTSDSFLRRSICSLEKLLKAL